MTTESVMYLDDDKAAPDDDAECCGDDGVVIPTDVLDKPDSGRETECYDETGEDRDDEGCCDDSTTLVHVFYAREAEAAGCHGIELQRFLRDPLSSTRCLLNAAHDGRR